MYYSCNEDIGHTKLAYCSVLSLHHINTTVNYGGSGRSVLNVALDSAMHRLLVPGFLGTSILIENTVPWPLFGIEPAMLSHDVA